MKLTRILFDVSKLPKSFSNFPEKYIKKQTEFIRYKPPNRPNYVQRPLRYRAKPYYDVYRPWEREFKQMNDAGVYQPTIYVEPIREFYMFLGDRVEILVGPDAGKQGFINYVVKERNWVFVEGLNAKRVSREMPAFPEGYIQIVEKPLLVPRDVALVDPSDRKSTMIKWRFDEAGNRVRVSLRTGRIIPIPEEAYSTADYKTKDTYVDKPKDTKPEVVSQVTFEAKVKTFEMDLMDEYGIQEDRKHCKNMFWY